MNNSYTNTSKGRLLWKLNQTETSEKPTIGMLEHCAWSPSLGVLTGYNISKDKEMINEIISNYDIVDSKTLARALNDYSNEFFGDLKGLRFKAGEDSFYIPFDPISLTRMKNIKRHVCFAYILNPEIEEYTTIRLLWDERLK